MPFNLFGLVGNGPGEEEITPSGQSAWDNFGNIGNGGSAPPNGGYNGFQWGQSGNTPKMEPAGSHPDDPPSMDAYPYGRPPLQPEQTKRAYARFFGLDPSTLDADNLQVPHPDSFQQNLGMEGMGTGQLNGFSGAASGYQSQFTPDALNSVSGTYGNDEGFQAQKIKLGAQAMSQDGGGNDATSNPPASTGNAQSGGNSQNGNLPSPAGEAPNSGIPPKGSFQIPLDKNGNPLPYSRKLTEWEKHYLREGDIDARVLDNITIHVGVPDPFFPKVARAYTKNANEIYIKPNEDVPDDMRSLHGKTAEKVF